MSASQQNKNQTTSSNSLVPDSTKNRKPFHQLFYSYLSLVAAVAILSLITVTWLLSEQHSKNQLIISEQLAPTEVRLLEQNYLIQSSLLVKKLLEKANLKQLTPLLNDLTVQSTKLSLLNTEGKITYKKWLLGNKSATDLINEIEAQHPNNELLKSNVLILLDTLIDAIDIELNNGNTLRKQKQILNNAQNHLMGLLLKLNTLGLTSSLSDFVILSEQIEGLFEEDFGKQLANQKMDNEKVEEIVKDFLRFKDLIVKRGVLSRWKMQLDLLNQYQANMLNQQAELVAILTNLSKQPLDDITLQNDETITSDIRVLSLPIWVVVFLTITFLTIFALLYLISYKIKSLNKFNIDRINEAIDGVKSFAKIYKNNSPAFSEESFSVIKGIQTLNEKNFTQAEYLKLKKANTSLRTQLDDMESVKEQILVDIEEERITNGTKSAVELQCLNRLYITAIKQLVHAGNSVVNSSVIESNHNAHEYQYAAFLQGRYLVRKLRQVNYYQYLKGNEAVLTLSHVDFVAQTQAALFNFHNKLLSCKNTVAVNIDSKVSNEVNIDAELFTEMLNVFISLCFAHKTRRHLTLNIVLTDKNDGQQQLLFTGDVGSKGEVLSLPKMLTDFNYDAEGKHELIDYFKLLLSQQNGSDLFTAINKKGYQLGFTLPLATVSGKATDSSKSNGNSVIFPASCSSLTPELDGIKIQYITMPIEILLAVKEPVKYQALQQRLHAIGLQTTFVSSELISKTSWRSGRFAVLMTDYEHDPFVDFMVDELNQNVDVIEMPRGVISLTGNDIRFTPPEHFSDWMTGQLSSDSNIEQVIKAMQPWLKNKANEEKIYNKTMSNDIASGTTEIKHLLTTNKSQPGFDFERYITNQGSVELALFMLDEYNNENMILVEGLEDAFYRSDTKNSLNAINKLRMNGNILGADNLLTLCQYWQDILESKGLNKTEESQIDLLKQTHEAVQQVSRYAEAVI